MTLSRGVGLPPPACGRYRGGDRLELWLPRNWPAEDSELRWRRVGAGGAVQKGAERGLEGRAPAEEVIVWTPAAETLFLRARLPTRSAAKIVQALPFALEEQLIDPPERLHFAFAHEADGALAVAVTRRERMESWLAALAAAGLSPTHLAPVTLSVPLAERAWTLAFVDGEIVLRSGARAGLGGPAERRPPAWLHAALAEARNEASAPERILLVDAPADLDSAAWPAALGRPLHPLRPADASAPPARWSSGSAPRRPTPSPSRARCARARWRSRSSARAEKRGCVCARQLRLLHRANHEFRLDGTRSCALERARRARAARGLPARRIPGCRAFLSDRLEPGRERSRKGALAPRLGPAAARPGAGAVRPPAEHA